jgi:hypothetical protein
MPVLDCLLRMTEPDTNEILRRPVLSEPGRSKAAESMESRFSLPELFEGRCKPRLNLFVWERNFPGRFTKREPDVHSPTNSFSWCVQRRRLAAAYDRKNKSFYFCSPGGCGSKWKDEERYHGRADILTLPGGGYFKVRRNSRGSKLNRNGSPMIRFVYSG